MRSFHLQGTSFNSQCLVMRAQFDKTIKTRVVIVFSLDVYGKFAHFANGL